MAIGQEQRQRQEQQVREAQRQEKEQEELQKLEEGQELSPEQAGHLQPQLGNAALASLLARSSAQASTGPAMQEEVAEELVEGQEEEEAHGEEREAPLFGGGGGGGGGGSGDPWDMGKLFGGDDDEDGEGGGGANPRLRPSPIRASEALPEDEPPPEDDPAAVDPSHLARVDAVLPPAAPGVHRPARGDAVHRAVEDALGDAAALARLSLRPEDLVGRGGPRGPLGRPLAIARFLAEHAGQARARATARALAGGAAALLVEATGSSGGAARLATLAVCAQAAEGGGAVTDRAVALALETEAWPRAVQAARVLVRKRRLHAPSIASRVLGTPLTEGSGTGGAELPPDALATRALVGLLPRPPALAFPDLLPPPLPPLAEDDAMAALDALLAEFTGGPDPRALPPDPVLDSEALQPLIDAASELVNLLGRSQVEFAAAAVAACRVNPSAPVLQALVHGDRALRLLAREAVEAGEGLAALRGRPRPGAAAVARPMVHTLRGSGPGLESLRAWVLGAVAAAAVKDAAGAGEEEGAGGAPGEAPGASFADGAILAAERARRGGDGPAARALLRAALAAASGPGQARDRRELSLFLGLAALEQGDRADAAAHLGHAWELSQGEAPDDWTAVAAGSVLAGLRLALSDTEGAARVAAGVATAARARAHWLAVADAAIVQAAVRAGEQDLSGAVRGLLDVAVALRREGAEAAVQVVKARLAELRAQGGAADFDLALAAAAAG